MKSWDPDIDPDPAATATGGDWSIAGAVLLLLTAIAHIAYGAVAISGIEALDDNVREIEADPRFGTLYLSLVGWGVLLTLAGLAELFAAWRLARRAPHARLAGLVVALPGLALSFFTLALFRGFAVVTAVILLLAMYVLSYRVPD